MQVRLNLRLLSSSRGCVACVQVVCVKKYSLDSLRPPVISAHRTSKLSDRQEGFFPPMFSALLVALRASRTHGGCICTGNPNPHPPCAIPPAVELSKLSYLSGSRGLKHCLGESRFPSSTRLVAVDAEQSGPEGIEKNLTPLSTGPGGNITQVIVGVPDFKVYGNSTKKRGKSQSTYLHTCISLHSSTHKSGYTLQWCTASHKSSGAGAPRLGYRCIRARSQRIRAVIEGPKHKLRQASSPRPNRACSASSTGV